MKILLSIALVAMLTQSCITSMQPLVTEKNVVKEDRIIGHWASGSSSYNISLMPRPDTVNMKFEDKETKRFINGNFNQDMAASGKLYTLHFRENKVEYYLTIMLAKINNQLFANIFPGAAANAGNHYDRGTIELGDNYDYFPGYTLAKIDITANNLSIKFVDGNFIQQEIEKGNMKLKHESNELFNSFMVTASSNELQQFIVKYGNDERIYSKKVITLTRKPANL